MTRTSRQQPGTGFGVSIRVALLIATGFIALEFFKIGVTAVGLPSPGCAFAADPSGRIAITGQVGGGLTQMGDVNRRIRFGNEFVTAVPRHWTPMDQIHHGFNFTWDLRSRITGPFSATVGGGSMFGQSKIDFDQVISVRPSMTFYHLRGIYQLPFRPMNSMILSLGAGPVYVSSAKLKVQHEHRTADGGTERIETVSFKGDGWGAHAFLQAEFVLTDKITLTTDLGYRHAKIPTTSMKWGITGRSLQYIDTNHNEVLDAYEFDPDSYLPHSFVKVIEDTPGHPQKGTDERPVLQPMGGTDTEFSGVLANVGLRFYLF